MRYGRRRRAGCLLRVSYAGREGGRCIRLALMARRRSQVNSYNLHATTAPNKIPLPSSFYTVWSAQNVHRSHVVPKRAMENKWHSVIALISLADCGPNNQAALYSLSLSVPCPLNKPIHCLDRPAGQIQTSCAPLNFEAGFDHPAHP